MSNLHNNNSKKLTIAFLYHANNIHVLNRAKYFLSQDHIVYYFGFLPDENAVQSDGLTNLQKIDIPKKLIIGKFNILNLISRVFYIRKLTRKYDIDVLHIQNAGFGIFTPFSKAKITILENMGSDVILLAEKNILRRILYRIAYKHVDGVIQDSFLAKRKGKQWGASGKNNYVINVGIDLSIFNKRIKAGVARKKLRIDKSQKFVFSPRGKSKLYNHDTVISTLPFLVEKYSNIVYVFTGLYSQDFFSVASNEIINNVKYQKNIVFTGMLDNRTELPDYYRDCDVLVSVPSSDSSPLTVYEAMACGAPVIVSQLPWYRGLFVKDRHIKVVPARDIESLREKILQVLADPSIINTTAAEKRVNKRLDSKTENHRLYCMYLKLLSVKVKDLH